VSSLFYVCTFFLVFLNRIHAQPAEVIMSTMPNSKDDFWKDWTIPEEDRCLFTSALWDSGYRWFRSLNGVCLENYRQTKANERPARRERSE
jgi:hypothetical protein